VEHEEICLANDSFRDIVSWDDI